MPKTASDFIDNSQLQFDFKFGFLLPWTFRFLGGLLILASILLIQKSSGLSLLLGPPGLIMLFSSEGTEINHTERLYREYTSFIFFKTGKFKAYQSIDKIFINQNQQSQKMYSTHTNQSSTFNSVIFNGYIKFASGEKVHLKAEKNKAKLIKNLERLSIPLNLAIVDNTLAN